MSQRSTENPNKQHNNVVGRSRLFKDQSKVEHFYLEAEVVLTPLLHAVHLTGIGWDEDRLNVDVMNSCSWKMPFRV